MIITSRTNPLIKRLKNLQKSRKAREEEGVFIAEGIHMFRELPGELVSEIYFSESFATQSEMYDEGASKIKFPQGILQTTLSDGIFEYVSDTKTPQGVLCVVKRPVYDLEALILGKSVRLLLLEDLQDPGNLGTILRTAEAAGVTAVIASNETADIFNPKTVRATQGSLFRVPYFIVSDFLVRLNALRAMGVRIYAAEVQAGVSIYEADFAGALALLIGNEGKGLSKEALELSHERLNIPMDGQVESLNAAVAAGVILFEIKRKCNSLKD
jgi:TrmH family RNA methyltransferase